MTPGEIAGFLETSGQAYASLLRILPPEVASWKPAPDEWCVNEVVGHVIEAEKRGFADRIQNILREDEPALEPWDQPGVTRARRDCERRPDGLRTEFEQVRRQSLELVRSLKPLYLERGGVHPTVARLTANDLLHEWVHHDANHLRQAYANVQAYVWPDMGNARRFTTG
jgi:hypothetical protein